MLDALRDAIFEDDDRHPHPRPDDDARWNQLVAQLTEAGVAGATKLSVRALSCVIEFAPEVSESVDMRVARIRTRRIEPRPPRRTDPPPADLQRALALLGNDLEPGGAAGITLSVEPGRVDDEAWMVDVHGEEGGGSSGSGFVLDGAFPELVAVLADSIQDRVIDLIWREWPACPHPGHPLGAWCDDQTGMVVCATDPDWKRAIGSLADDHEYVAAIRRRPFPAGSRHERLAADLDLGCLSRAGHAVRAHVRWLPRSRSNTPRRSSSARKRDRGATPPRQ